MGFLNPALLGLLGLGSVPILIHLLNRRRHQVVRWSAMAFLLKAQVKTRQRLRMENLLLLLARTLAVLLFAFAASRPYLPSAAGLSALAPDRQHLYILVDNSASMGYQEGISSLLQRASREARSVVDNAQRSDDPLTHVLACDEIRRRNGRPLALLRGTRDHGKVKDALDRIPLSDARMDPAAALAEVLAVAEPGDPRRTLLVLSDFPRVDWDPLGVGEGGGEGGGGGKDGAPTGGEGTSAIRAQLDRLREAGFELAGAFRFIASPEVEDVAVVALATADGRAPSDGRPVSFEVVVANNGAAPLTADVRLSVDGREVGSARLPVPGRGPRSASPATARTSFPWSGSSGSHFAEAAVEAPGNRLKANDRLGHAFTVRDRVRVLAVDGDPSPGPGRFPETRLLGTALRLRRGLAPSDVRVIEADDLPRETFADLDVVILANVPEVPAPTWDRLSSFVKRGGGLFVFLGDRVLADGWNGAMRRAGVEDLLPARLGAAPRVDPENPVPADLTLSEHPALRDLVDDRGGASFEPPLVGGWWPVADPLPEGTEVLLRLHDLARTPLLLARHHGRGHAVLCTTSADLDWMGMSLVYAPLVQEVVAWLADAGQERRDLVVHEALQAEVPDGARDISVVLLQGGDRQPLGSDLEALRRGGGEGAEAGPRSILFPDTSAAGIYAVRWKAPADAAAGAQGLVETERHYAANLDPREADTARAGDKALGERLQVKGLGASGDVESEAREREREAARGDLTGLVLSFAALLVIVEMFLAAWFGRKRR